MTPHLPGLFNPPPLSAPAPLSVHLQRPDAWLDDTHDSSFNDLGSDTAACGMPAERHARLAAQRAFAALKQSFLYVVDGLAGQAELQCRVHAAEAPHELWALRPSVFAALTGDDPQHRSRRQLINRSLDTLFTSVCPQLN